MLTIDRDLHRTPSVKLCCLKGQDSAVQYIYRCY